MRSARRRAVSSPGVVAAANQAQFTSISPGVRVQDSGIAPAKPCTLSPESCFLYEDYRLLRRNLEAPIAPLARQHVVDPDEVVAELDEHGAVALVGAGRDAVFFRAPDPAHLIFV